MKTKYLIGNRHNTRTKYEKMNRHKIVKTIKKNYPYQIS